MWSFLWSTIYMYFYFGFGRLPYATLIEGLYSLFYNDWSAGRLGSFTNEKYFIISVSRFLFYMKQHDQMDLNFSYLLHSGPIPSALVSQLTSDFLLKCKISLNLSRSFTETLQYFFIWLLILNCSCLFSYTVLLQYRNEMNFK